MTALTDVDRFKLCIKDCVLPDFRPLIILYVHHQLEQYCKVPWHYGGELKLCILVQLKKMCLAFLDLLPLYLQKERFLVRIFPRQ